MSYFAIVREQLAQAVTVDSYEASGFRQKENMKFTEIEDWKKANPGKATPAASIEKVPVLQKDGSTQIKEGVWKSLDAAGVHMFERYHDRGVTTKRNLHNSAMGSLGETHAEDMHTAANAQLRIARPLSMEELANLTVAADEGDGGRGSGNYDDDSDESSDVDDEKAQKACFQAARPLFTLRSTQIAQAKHKPALNGIGGGSSAARGCTGGTGGSGTSTPPVSSRANSAGPRTNTAIPQNSVEMTVE